MFKHHKVTQSSISTAMIAGLVVSIGLAAERSTLAQLPSTPVPLSEPFPGTVPFPTPPVETSTPNAAEEESMIPVSLEGFSPENDGFSFTNQTSADNLEEDLQWQEENITTWHTGYSDLLRFMFGDDRACESRIWDRGDCDTAPSARIWVSKQARAAVDSGVCDGMAVASQILWILNQSAGDNPFGARSQSLADLTKGTASLDVSKLQPSNESLQNFLLESYVSQTTDEIYNEAEASRKQTPQAILDQVYSSIANYSATDQSWKDLVTIGIHKKEAGKLIEGHTLVPFAVEQNGDIAKISVYDPNFPKVTKELEINTSTGQWNYQPGGGFDYSGDENSQTLGVITLAQRTIPYFSEQGFASCPYCSQEEGSKLLVRLSSEGNIRKIALNARKKAGFNAETKTAEIADQNSGIEIVEHPVESQSAQYSVSESFSAYDLYATTVGFELKLEKPELDAVVTQENDNWLAFFNPSPDILAFGAAPQVSVTYKDSDSEASYTIDLQTTRSIHRYYILNKDSQRFYFAGYDGQANYRDNNSPIKFDITITRTIDGKAQTVTMNGVENQIDEFHYVDVKKIPWDSLENASLDSDGKANIPAGIHGTKIECAVSPGACMRSEWERIHQQAANPTYPARPQRGTLYGLGSG